jgi:nucleoside-diphosphate-sugar epimerase
MRHAQESGSMIVGTGMLARAFAARFADDPRVLVYAAGVSNSGCTDEREFAREKRAFEDCIAQAGVRRIVAYFGTCSANDPDARDTPYVRHKLDMEDRVQQTPRHIVLRLPQVVGRTPNPHTLLNFLHARIARSERFALWTGAQRNVIDLDDVVAAVLVLFRLRDPLPMSMLNIANTRSYSARQIVAALERVTGKRAIFDEVARGSSYVVDVDAALPLFADANVRFDDRYLDRVVRKYYG